jgi:tagaturonate reductase
MQYSSKMAIRNVPLFLKNSSLNRELPFRMMIGFAAYLLFMKTEKNADGLYYRTIGNKTYQVNDEKAELLYHYWFGKNTFEAVNDILSDNSLWGTNLHLINGFCKKTVDLIENLKEGVDENLKTHMK